jgi:hypothetical protein
MERECFYFSNRFIRLLEFELVPWRHVSASFTPDSPIDPAKRGDFHIGELRLSHKASLCAPPIYIIREPYVLFM